MDSRTRCAVRVGSGVNITSGKARRPGRCTDIGIRWPRVPCAQCGRPFRPKIRHGVPCKECFACATDLQHDLNQRVSAPASGGDRTARIRRTLPRTARPAPRIFPCNRCRDAHWRGLRDWRMGLDGRTCGVDERDRYRSPRAAASIRRRDEAPDLRRQEGFLPPRWNPLPPSRSCQVLPLGILSVLRCGAPRRRTLPMPQI